jgi:hypothetical protein
MSQTTKPGRYQRSSGGLVGAMIVTVLAVLAFAAFRAIFRDNAEVPVRSVDYQGSVEAARAEKLLFVVAPEKLPSGWRATSATYSPGASPSWHLGTLTAGRKYVGVEESRASIEDLVEQHVDPQAERGKDVTIDGQTWQSWTDAGGDYAVARSARSGARPVESWVVVGTAPEAEIRDFAGTLEGAPSGS